MFDQSSSSRSGGGGDRGQSPSLLPLPHHIIHLPKLTVSLLYFCFYLSLSAPLSLSLTLSLSLFLSGQCHDIPLSARCGVEMKPARTKLALAEAHMSVGAAVFVYFVWVFFFQVSHRRKTNRNADLRPLQ